VVGAETAAAVVSVAAASALGATVVELAWTVPIAFVATFPSSAAAVGGAPATSAATTAANSRILRFMVGCLLHKRD
jgi:hypothetical protein